MIVDFILSLIILSFAFRIMLMILSVPLKWIVTLVFAPMFAGRIHKSSFLAAIVNPIFLSAFYGCFIALLTLKYSRVPNAGDKYLYLVCGAVAAFLCITSYSAGLRAKIGGHVVSSDLEDRAHRIAATWSLASGFVAFPAAFYFPQYILAMPGVRKFFIWVFGLAYWLEQFKVVQIILAVAISGFILFTAVRGFIWFLKWMQAQCLRITWRIRLTFGKIFGKKVEELEDMSEKADES